MRCCCTPQTESKDPRRNAAPDASPRVPSVPPLRQHFRKLIPHQALPVKPVFACLLLLSASLSCQTSGAGAGAMGMATAEPRAATLEEVIEFERTVTLQDRGAVTTVLPVVSLEPGGNFFVVDPREFQIRRYDSLGTLLSYFGRPGGGPGEFTRLVGAVQRQSGSVVAADANGNLLYLDSAGKEMRRFNTRLGPIYNIALVNDSTLALTGRVQGQTDGPFVHLWDVNQGRITGSFFRMPPHPSALDPAYAFAGAVDVAIRGDTAAAVIALSDTVYLFTLRGEAIGKMPIPSEQFRRIARPPPTDMQGDPAARAAWGESFSRVSKLFWVPDGSLYVQYFDLSGLEPRWSLVHMRRDGKPPVEIHDMPRLLAVSPFDARLYFIHPQSSEPNVWVIGTRSPGF